MIMVKPDKNIIRSQQTRIRYNRIASIYNLLEAIPTSFIDNWRKKLLVVSRIFRTLILAIQQSGYSEAMRSGSLQNSRSAWRSCHFRDVFCQSIHIQILSSSPPCSSYMPESGCNQHQSGLAVREGSNNSCPSSDFPHETF